LHPSETAYVARSPQRQTLRFSRSGYHSIERLYRTHWVSPELSEQKRERLAEKANRPPELVVVQALHAWACHRCGGTGGLLTMEDPGLACLGCVGLGYLAIVSAGEALLTRRVTAKSARHAVVVRFSGSRWHYEPHKAASARKMTRTENGQTGMSRRATVSLRRAMAHSFGGGDGFDLSGNRDRG
jgi:hypothetical protein